MFPQFRRLEVEAKVSAELVPSEGWEGEPAPSFSLSFRGVTGSVWSSLGCRRIVLISAVIFTWRVPVCGSTFLLLHRCSHIGLGSTRMTSP